MIKVEHLETFNWEGALRGCRNPKNSWAKSDSKFDPLEIGPNDMRLMKMLYNGGPVHRKFLRQIFVSMDITAPIYFNQEMDTYKVGTARDSCSFQHKGTAKPFSIRDFSVDDERIYEILDPIKIPNKHDLIYPYETDEYRVLSIYDRSYKVFKNSKIISEEYSVTDSVGNRTKHFPERELKPTQTSGGYWMLNLGGRRHLRKMMLHRIVAAAWLGDANGKEINHIDGNKGNNSVENLEWVTRSENMIHAINNGLAEYSKSLRHKYCTYRTAHKVNYFDEEKIRNFYKNGMEQKDIAQLFGIKVGTVSTICNIDDTQSFHELFTVCGVWEKIINELNRLRDMYLETDDYSYFRAIRELLPMGYLQKYTLTMSYENVMNILDWRTDHRLQEWKDLCAIFRNELPYIKEIRGEE